MAEDEAKKVISQIAKQLAASKTCPNKTTLVKLLKQATSALSELKQSESLKFSIKPLSDSLIKHGLLDHKDKDIRHLLGICLGEVIRLLAPNPDFSHTVSRDIFRFLISIFGELDDTASPYFSRRAKLLETVAKLHFCLIMLDAPSEDLILKMFKTFFSVLREDHPQSLINSMSVIITSILEEKLETDPDPLERNTFHSLLDLILQNIIEQTKGVASSSFRLAGSVIQNSGEKLESYICHFLTSCILNRDAIGGVIKESYHEIIIEIYQIAPQMLLSVLPCLTHELLTDQVDVRIKALNLIRKLLSLHGRQVARQYPHVFIELLNRFSDKSAEVRLTALSCAKLLYLSIPSGTESLETLSVSCKAAIQGRLLDHDDKVRTEAVNVVCELAKAKNFNCSDLITQAAERLRDKKVLVRSKALKKLVEVYQEYCTRRAAAITLLNEHVEEIPSKILMLCYEKDCQEFRPQSMELVLADLFPASLSIEERTSHWILMFSLFKPPHLKALRTILSQKRRLRDGLKNYLDLCNQAAENGTGEAGKKMEALVLKMSSCFPDPAKAQDCFQKLKELKDNGIFSLLEQYLTKGTALNPEITMDEYLRQIGDQKALSEFCHLILTKCSFNIFGSEHVHYILDCLSSNEAKNKHLKSYRVQLLLTIVSAFPSLLRGSEKKFQLLLLEGEIPFNEQLIDILARKGHDMSIKLSDIYSSLEKVCLEGTRAQSKLAVSAIAALADPSEKFILSKLCQTLVDSLCSGQNTHTVLQSLGCMAQHSISTFEAQEKLTRYIVEEIFQQNDVLATEDLDFVDDTSNCCSYCKLKVFGLKALVRSFLPLKHGCLSRPISFLLDIIQQMLQKSGFSADSITCEHDEAFIRLAAAKAILRLSRKWDLHISPQIFRLTILTAKDHSPRVRRLFASKIHKLLNNHAVPSRYACAFSFVALDSLEDLRSDALKYLEEFVSEYGKGSQIQETMSMQVAASHPLYLVVYLIHVLAHDSNFPAPNCRDEKIYAWFVSPLFVTMQALVNGNFVNGHLHHISNALSYMRSIFNAIKRAEDAVDVQMTPKLHLLAEVGISILESLNTRSVPVPHTPGLVLLPSSLYKSGSSERREANAHPLIGCKVDANFTKKLVHCLKTQVPGIGSSGVRHSQQFDDNSLKPSGTRQAKSGHTNNMLTNKTKEQIDELHTGQKEQRDTSNCEVHTRARKNQAMSLHLGSVVLHNEFSAENKHQADADKNLSVKSSFLGDSATAKPSSSQNEVIISSREEDIVTKCQNICAEPSKLSRARDKVNCSTSKIIKLNGEELVGKRIKLWSPIEKCYYSGMVDNFDPTKSTHQVTYESGEVDILSLDSEEWNILSLDSEEWNFDPILNKDFTLRDIDDLQTRNRDHSSDLSANNQAKSADAYRYDSEQENLPKNRDLGVRKVSQAVKKRAKRCKDAIGMSTSELIDTTGTDIARRRTRRQKI